VREQANRISACRMTIGWSDDNLAARHGKSEAEGFTRENIINGILSLRGGKDNQGALWEDTVELTDSFYSALCAHPVPLWEPALRAISSQPFVLDIYIWLCYRLYSVKKPTPITWEALQAQFGPEYSRPRDFRRRFSQALAEAQAVYPDAHIRLTNIGIELHPSRPAVAQRIHTIALPR